MIHSGASPDLVEHSNVPNTSEPSVQFAEKLLGDFIKSRGPYYVGFKRVLFKYVANFNAYLHCVSLSLEVVPPEK